MTAQIIPLHPHGATDTSRGETPCPSRFVDVPAVADSPQPGRLRRAYERGMATAEYAVGILAAAALALVLLHVFTDNSFFQKMLKFVIELIGKIAPMIGS